MKGFALIAAAAAPAAAAFAVAGLPAPDPGERAHRKCYACHALEPGRNDLDGPTLYGIVGRPVAAEPGFDYSPALKRFAQRNPRWTRKRLDRFIADPEAAAPGTTMAFAGVRDASERAALIDFLEKRSGGGR